jgi:hypothetical protein
VVRFSLDPSGTPTRCTDFVAAVPTNVYAIGWMPPDEVAVATVDELDALDATTGILDWQQPLTNMNFFPNDLFPLQTPTGESLVAIAYAPQGGSEINSIYAYDHATSALVNHWTLNDGMFVLGLSWVSMTQQPSRPTHFFAQNDLSDIALRDVDPFNNLFALGDVTTTRFLHHVSALSDGKLRVAWTGDATTSDDSVFYLNAAGQVSSPIACSVAASACEFQRATPDPTSMGSRYFAVCWHSAVLQGQVVRLTTSSVAGSSCEVIYDTTGLGQRRPFAIAIAQ